MQSGASAAEYRDQGLIDVIIGSAQLRFSYEPGFFQLTQIWTTSSPSRSNGTNWPRCSPALCNHLSDPRQKGQ